MVQGLGDIPQEGASTLRAGFPKFIVVHLEGEDALVGCPRIDGRCGNQFIIHYPTWVDMKVGKALTRACPYCFKASAIPTMTITPSESV